MPGETSAAMTGATWLSNPRLPLSHSTLTNMHSGFLGKCHPIPAPEGISTSVRSGFDFVTTSYQSMTTLPTVPRMNLGTLMQFLPTSITITHVPLMHSLLRTLCHSQWLLAEHISKTNESSNGYHHSPECGSLMKSAQA